MPHAPYLLAAADWIQLLFIVLFFVIPVLSKLMGGGNKDAVPKPAERRPVQPQRPGQGPRIPQPGQGPKQAAAGGQAPDGNALEKEIEAFLRRSRGEKPEPKPQPIALQDESQEHSRRLVEKPRSIKEQSPEPQRESVAEHVQRHISSHPVSDHARELGKAVGQVDEALESRLHNVFDHSLGSLAKDEIAQPDREGTDAAVWETAESKRQRRADAMEDRSDVIADMLRNPESIKQAIILGEVLKRPDF